MSHHDAAIQALFEQLQTRTDISIMQKRLLTRIAYQSQFTGYCTDTNAQFLVYFKRCKKPVKLCLSTLHKWIADLEQKGYLHRRVEGKTRRLQIPVALFPFTPSVHSEKPHTHEETQDICTPSVSSAQQGWNKGGNAGVSKGGNSTLKTPINTGELPDLQDGCHTGVSANPETTENQGVQTSPLDQYRTIDDIELNRETERFPRTAHPADAHPSDDSAKWSREAIRMVTLFLRPNSQQWEVERKTLAAFSVIRNREQFVKFVQWLNTVAGRNALTGKNGFKPSNGFEVIRKFQAEQQEAHAATPLPQPVLPQPAPIVDVTNLASIEAATKQLIEQRVNGPNFNTWIRPIHLSELNGKAVWGVPDDVFVYWLDGHYQPIMRETLQKLTGKAIPIEFVVAAMDG